MPRNLLIITQKVDRDDQLLGFFIPWLRKFADHFEKVTVLCLEQGSFNLPNLVQVKAALSSIGIETTKIAKEKNAFVLRIGRQEAIQKYLKLIGFSNKHHIK